MSMHAVSRALGPLILLLAVGCGQDDDVAGAPDPVTPVPPFAVVVSNVITSSAQRATTGHEAASLVVDGPVAYVSLLPGAVPRGATVTVRNMTSGVETTAPIIDGGVDPVEVAALEGNALRIMATDSIGASYTHVTMAKRRAPPRVVRTDPGPRKTAVPLNAVIHVVFSEPVDLSTVESSVQVRQASGPVSGTMSLVPGSPGVIAFVPDSPLAAETNYTIDIDTGVLDLDGDPLVEEVSVTFMTIGTVTPPATGVARVRVVHAATGVGAMDILVDGTEVASDLPYLATTDYLDITSGSHVIWYQVSSGTMDEYRGSLAAGGEYTALPCCERFPLGGALLTDDNSEPPTGQARIRIVDYASVSSSVRIYLTAPGADLVAAVPLTVDATWATEYITVPAGDYQLRITPFDSDVVAIDSGLLTVLAGQVRTVIAVDAPGGGAPYDFLVLEDRN